MEKTLISVILVWPVLAVCFTPLTTLDTPHQEELQTTRSHQFLDPFLGNLPPPSQGDEPIGPHGDQEKKNSAGILDMMWNKTTGLPSVIQSVDNSSTDNLPTPNVTGSPVTTMQPDYNDTQVNYTTVQETSSENSSNTVPSETESPTSTGPSQTATAKQTPVMVTMVTSPVHTLSTKSPKMPQTTSSSNPLFSSPGINGTLHPRRQRAKHPIVFLLLPFLIAGGVALLILLGSYLRKKIRLDKLRHQLMPLYSFDPAEGEDWETELLTEPRASSQPTVTITKASASSSDPPKLRFAPDTVEV